MNPLQKFVSRTLLPKDPAPSALQPGGFSSARRATRIAMTLLWLAGSVAFTACGPDEPLFDHVVLVTIDTLRADHLGCYGYPRKISPFIDWLASRGVVFDKAISSSSHTAPSHSSMFTSQYPSRHGVLTNGMPLDPKIPTMASLFQGAGFQTAAVISARFLRTITPGFEEVRHKAPRPVGYWQADRVVDEALAWFEGRDRDLRFFLWVHLYDVHNSREDPTRFPLDHVRELKEDFERNRSQLQEVWRGQGIPAHLVQVPGDLNTYDAQIAFVDDELERLFHSVESRVKRDRVLWVITADHGEGLGNHGLFGHGLYLYQEQIRTPLLFYGEPQWKELPRVSEVVRHVDLLPSLGELTGVDVEGGQLQIEGRSLTGFLGQEGTTWVPAYALAQRRLADDRLLAEGWSRGPVLSLQDGRYKYILKAHGEDEFYDLENDPQETRNLIETESLERERMASWLARKYERMVANPLGAKSEIEEEFVEELEALGYL